MRKDRTLKRGVAVVALALTGVAAFATIAPGPEVGRAPESRLMVEPLAIEPAAALLPSPASFIREERFQRGDTRTALLSRLGIGEAHIDKLARLRAMQQVRPGVAVVAEVSAEGELVSLSFLTGRDTLIEIVPVPEPEAFGVREQPAPLETLTTMKSGVVHSSLFGAADSAGIPDSIAIQIAEIFGGDIDFHRDLRKGDRFSVVYELHYLNGRAVRAGRVLAGEFVNQGKSLRAVHFTGSDGKGGYYAPDGKNLRKAFLRSPLEFSRISSGFGMRRHPFLQTWRQHKGVDYAAPTGTRVRAVGDGIVDFAGVRGGYGNVVILRHHGQYSTLYAHLSRFGAGVRRGARITQGDTIGFVGQTGWATGPHLHYEFLVAGEARNPFAIAMPAALPVASHDLKAFRSHAEPLVARLELLATINLALLE
jgi:murein DD-endopeptidase MepM/ murein hydrolase activator NlpD